MVAAAKREMLVEALPFSLSNVAKFALYAQPFCPDFMIHESIYMFPLTKRKAQHRSGPLRRSGERRATAAAAVTVRVCACDGEREGE